MSITQQATNSVFQNFEKCPRCRANLPHGAAFCGSCGERLDKKKALSSLLQEEQDITSRYRIVSLVRRRPYVNLYLALDNRQPSHQGRMVAMRDISLASLDEQERERAVDLVRQEYDLLRHWQLPHVMSAIDLRYFQGNLFLVAAFASPTQPAGVGNAGDAAKVGENAGEAADDYWPRLSTLQDFLQSGHGLPSEQRTLHWIGLLCSALDKLHRHQVVIGDLDPSTIILNGESEEAEPAFMISWLIPALRKLLPQPASSAASLSYFIAPEAIQGEADARSDIYSLGAILYLLLTGMPPAESTLRYRTRLRTPQEVNARISPHVSESVMQALSIDPAERFQYVLAFSEALRNPRYRRPLVRRETGAAGEQSQDVETVRIVPLSRKDAERWRNARSQLQTVKPHRVPQRPEASISSASSPPTQPTFLPEEIVSIESDWEQARASGTQLASAPTVPGVPSTPLIDPDAPNMRSLQSPEAEERDAASLTAEYQDRLSLAQPAEEVQVNEPVQTTPQPELQWSWETPVTAAPQALPAEKPQPVPAARTWKQRIMDMFKLKRVGARFIAPTSASAVQAPVQSPVQPAQSTGNAAAPGDASASWIDQLKHIVLGEQQHVIAAAAIVETPLRVLPDQMYTIRLHIMGRDEPLPGASKRDQSGGLSALVHGDMALIEVRSVLHQSYAYIVQQANVTIPAEGYAAEVVIPMQPLANAPTGRRDRLHIFFLEENRHPLYEKPFVVEIFVSPHVKRGNEGHHVLTIPV